ncbi:MAG: damage-control phosphatase ARMT1 family protein [Anaerolineales bacterium]|nr:damage-control phosphatase ARMT1 family protein [Anaerolineales bacterium]
MTKTTPPPIFSTEPGSWAHSTVKERFPETTRRVIQENKFSAEINQELHQLEADIPDQPIRQLKDLDAPDQEAWQRYIQPHEGKNWLVVPWFFAEHYFYRRIIEAVNFFQFKQDPFKYQKEQGLEKTRADIQTWATILADGLNNNQKVEKTLRDGIYYTLWGNQADLSLWPAGSDKSPKHNSQKSLLDHLLVNDINRVTKYLCGEIQSGDRVDIMLDNAGFEVVCDLGLADILLSHQLANEIVLHVKAHPTFVSDVIEEDLGKTIQFLTSSPETHTEKLGRRLAGYFEDGKIQAKAHFFWNSPLPMWKLPTDLADDLKKSSLLISKGDANYRRLLGDREWDFTTPFHQAVDFLPVPLVALRTSKAELAVGLELDQIQFVFNQDSKWLVDGRWGFVQFAPAVNEQGR